jgi:electron transport complex protein RnfC
MKRSGQRTFSGGIHPPQHKSLSSESQVEILSLPERVYIPLSQHTGAIAEPAVSAGDGVRAGEKVGDSTAFVSAPVHASVSGKVSAISVHPHPVSGRQKAIVIEREGDEWVELEGHAEYSKLSPGEIREIIRSAGIVGLGGAAFPTVVKVSPPEHVRIDSLIVNGAECEPYLTADYRLMVENAKEIAAGIEILMHALGVSRSYVAIEDNKPLALREMEKAASVDAGIEVVPVRTKYPQGSEKQLIKAVLNREVPSGGLPMDVGVVVNNVGTAIAVREAVVLGKPLVERVVTVTGPNIRQPKNLRVRIGTPFKDLIDFCGGTVSELAKLVAGGPLMGIAQYSLETPVIKGTSGIIVFGVEDAGDSREVQCLRCGFCVDTCPMGLMPCDLVTNIEKGHWDEVKRFGLSDCMECGSCAYVCPARRPLVQLIKYGKAKLAAD